MRKTSKFLSMVCSLAAAAGMLSASVPVLADGETWIDSASLSDKGSAAPVKDDVLPDANQFRYQKDELAAFCHFGPNTFNEIEWGEYYGNSAPSEIFRLTNDFDAETYVKTIHDAGFKKLIVTAKHHDGFCIFDSKYTEYDSTAAGYKGDVLAELSAACTKYNIDMGLYLSPWDIHDASYGYKDANGNALCGSNGQPLNNMTWEEVEELDVLDYNEYYNNQLEEILGNDKYGNNGHFVEVWMDGAKGSGTSAQNYNFNQWFDTIQKHEGKAAGYDADCMLFGAESYTTVRWIGNENGFADKETWSKSTINRQANTIDSNTSGGYTKGFENGNQWTVPEADARITSGWFWGNNKKTPKTLKDLGEMYFRSVGNGATLLLNFPPNSSGTLDQAIIDRTLEFGAAIEESFADNLLTHSGVSIKADNVRGMDTAYSPARLVDADDETIWSTDDGTSTGTIHIDLGGLKNMDCISIEEAIQYGQRINSWSVRYKNDSGWHDLDSGKTIGPKRLIRTQPFNATEIEITVTTPSGKTPVLSEIGAYRLAEEIGSPRKYPDGVNVVDIKDNAFEFTGTWNNETGEQYINGTNTYANPGASFTYTFTGRQCVLLGTLDPNHGTADVYIDDKLVETINMSQSPRQVGAEIFVSPTLSAGEHTLRLETKTKATGIEAAYAINNSNKGMVTIENDAYTMNEDETLEIKLLRTGGSAPITVTFSPNPGSAIQDDFFTDLIHTVNFAEDETEKTVTVKTRRNTNATGTQFFTGELSCSDNEVIFGTNPKTRINILDMEEQMASNDYSAAKPFVFPSAMEQSEDLEAARATINDYVHPNDGQWSMVKQDADWGLNGRIVNCFNQQDTMTVPYYAAKAGTYNVTVYYRSGDPNNSLVWAEADGKITAGSAVAGASDPETTQHVTFEMTVETPGAGTLVFTGPDKKSPMLSHFTITPKELITVKHTLSVNVGDHGSADFTGTKEVEEGDAFDLVITPDAGYELDTVLVNGTAVSVTGNTLHLDAIDADTVISVLFRKESDKFAFPTVVNGSPVVLEAESFELHNTGENEAWPLQISDAGWASNGQFVNACNNGDWITLPYTAEKAGTYRFVLTFRSGDSKNSISWIDESGKIEAGSVTAGADDEAGATHTQAFEVKVLEAGDGVLRIDAGTYNAPQMDKFEITLIEEAEEPGEELVYDQLETAVDAVAEKLDELNSQALITAYNNYKALIDHAASQEEINAAAKALNKVFLDGRYAPSADKLNALPDLSK